MIKVILLLLSYIMCMYFGWSIQNNENESLKKIIASYSKTLKNNDVIQINQNIDLLLAIKEKKYEIIESAIIKETKFIIEDLNFNSSEKNIVSLKEKIIRYEEEHCNEKKCFIDRIKK